MTCAIQLEPHPLFNPNCNSYPYELLGCKIVPVCKRHVRRSPSIWGVSATAANVLNESLSAAVSLSQVVDKNCNCHFLSKQLQGGASNILRLQSLHILQILLFLESDSRIQVEAVSHSNLMQTSYVHGKPPMGLHRGTYYTHPSSARTFCPTQTITPQAKKNEKGALLPTSLPSPVTTLHGQSWKQE